MYSVVLMMAMTSGVDVPVDGLFDHGGGCCGSSSCYGGGCCGSSSCHGGGLFGGHSSCHGGGLFGGGSCCHGGGLFSGHSSCHGGGVFGGGSCCHGGGLFGGHSSCHGGGLFSGHGSCHGGGYCSGGYGGCCGGYGGACTGSYGGGCCGGAPIVPTAPIVPGPVPAKPEAGKVGEVTSPTPATIVVNLPADAKLLVDGNTTKSISAERTFVSPALQPNNLYRYTLKAEFQKDGQTMSVTKVIEVRAGLETRVTIDANEAIASK
jgi:uncharacterized protein (TIGR03000 family)